MKPVSQEFLDEQLKPISAPVLWRVVLSHSTAGNKDITAYVIRDSLQRIEWQVEDTITQIGSPDVQMSLYYDADLWDYLRQNTNIEITVQCGFRESELLAVFTGWVDSANVELDSKGNIYLRGYSLTTKCEAEAASNPYSTDIVPVRRLIDDQMKALGINNRTIRVKAIDVDDYVWSEFDSAEILNRLPRDGVLPWLVVDEHTIIRAHVRQGVAGRTWSLIKIAFTDDHHDYNLTTCEIPIVGDGDLVDIIRWDDEHVAVTYGVRTMFLYEDGDSWRSEYDYELTRIYVISVADMTIAQTRTYSRYTESGPGFEFIPMAASARHFDRQDILAIVWNIRDIVAPKKIHSSRYEMRTASTNVVIFRQNILELYFHPYTGACAGHDSDDWYFALLGYSGNWNYAMQAMRSYGTAVCTGSVGGTCTQWRGALSPFGKYACGDCGLVANILNFDLQSFWPSTNTPMRVKTTFDGPYQIITGYSSGDQALYLRTFFPPSAYGSWEIIDPFGGIIPDGYDEIHGFAWFFPDGERKVIAGVMRSKDLEDNYHQHSVFYGSKWYPYVSVDITTMNKRELFDEVARAFCCTCHFPDNDTGIFMSRDYIPAETYVISPDLFSADFTIKTIPEYTVNVNGVRWGRGTQELRIDSQCIPDVYAIKHAIAGLYYNFLKEWNREFSIVGDFLVQYEPLDIVKIYSSIDDKFYLGRIMNTVQEGAMVRITARGKEA